MNDPPARSYTRLAIAIVVAAIVISASALSYSSFEATVTRTSTTTATTTDFTTSTFTSTDTSTETITSTRNVTVTISGSPTSTGTHTDNESQTGQVTFYRSNGDWNFSVTLSSLIVPKGQPIDAFVNITNISGQTQRVHEVGPIINPAIYSENGTQVWALDPPQVNFFTNVTSGPGTSNGPWVISTSDLSPGHSYVLSIWPFIGTSATGNSDYQIGESLMVNATISVT